MLELAPVKLSPLRLQVWLYEKESEHIAQVGEQAANKIDADLVLTKDAKSELKEYAKQVISLNKNVRARLNYLKLKLGEVIIQVNIVIARGARQDVNSFGPSNILTWVNKRPISQLGARAEIDTNNPLQKPLLDALRKLQREINSLDNDGVFIRNFPQTKQKATYLDVLERADMDRYKRIISSWERVCRKGNLKMTAQIVHNAVITHDKCLHDLLDKESIEILMNGYLDEEPDGKHSEKNRSWFSKLFD